MAARSLSCQVVYIVVYVHGSMSCMSRSIELLYEEKAQLNLFTLMDHATGPTLQEVIGRAHQYKS